MSSECAPAPGGESVSVSGGGTGKQRRRRWLLGLGAALLALAGSFLVFKEPILRRLAVVSIQQGTGLRAEIGELRSSVGSGVFEVRDLTLYNLKEFGGSLLARVPELFVDLDAERAAEGVVRFRQLRLHLAELHVVKDQAGHLNIDGVEKKVREHVSKRLRRRRDKSPEFQFGGIDQLQLTLRQVRYTDLKDPGRTREFDLRLDNEVVTTLRTEEDVQTWIGAILFRIVLQQSFEKDSNQ